jgi:hypothetical protein
MIDPLSHWVAVVASEGSHLEKQVRELIWKNMW